MRLCGEGSKNRCLSPVSVAPSACCLSFFRITTVDLPWRRSPVSARSRQVSLRDERDKTLSGGSLGSCVDEERSQLREVM